ncbi:unnamed protein product [Lactuca saligna]|uniref:Aldehyde dehydrogenase domain-containing protein n=1 Tax=Lactuca saligna TaxID=75948 RepID=A0AA35V5H0_LACSI|nr:unnamed protein product [Lactuca saligna]
MLQLHSKYMKYQHTHNCFCLIESTAKEFLEKVVKLAKNIKIPDPLEEGCRLGSVVSGEQYEKILIFVETAKSEGATISFGGKRPEHLKSGFYIEATIISDVTTSMQIWREKVFGPILCVKSFQTEEEAIEKVIFGVYNILVIKSK